MGNSHSSRLFTFFENLFGIDDISLTREQLIQFTIYNLGIKDPGHFSVTIFSVFTAPTVRISFLYYNTCVVGMQDSTMNSRRLFYDDAMPDLIALTRPRVKNNNGKLKRTRYTRP